MAGYQGPRRMKARYAGTCAQCGDRFPAGAIIVWFPTTRAATHVATWCQDRENREALALQMPTWGIGKGEQ